MSFDENRVGDIDKLPYHLTQVSAQNLGNNFEGYVDETDCAIVHQGLRAVHLWN